MSRAPQRITTVLTPAPSANLIDLPTLKLLLGITDGASDAFLKIAIGQASAAASRYCNRTFVVETVLDQIWPWRDGCPWALQDDRAQLQLSRWPILAVLSVIETIAGVGTPLVAAVDYLPDPDLAQLIRLDRTGMPISWRSHPVAVTYRAGYAAIPPDIIDAVARLVKAAWFARGRDPMLRSQTAPGVYEAQYWFGAGPASSAALPPDITGLLDRYRVPVAA